MIRDITMSKFPVKWLFLALVLISCQFNLVQGEDKKEATKKVNKITFNDHIQPILRSKCLSCHNPNKKSSGLDMSSYTSLMVGGSSGEVIEPGSADDSYLYLLVTHESEPFMPPKADKMPTDVLNQIRDWINAGAPENAGSKPLVSKKPKFDLALAAPGGKPEIAPMPGRLSLEPLTQTVRTGAVTALASNPWSPIIAIAGQKQVLLYNSKSLELVGTLAFPEGIAYSLKFSRNGNLLLAGGGRGAALGKTVVWNLKTGERIIEVGDELDTVLGADISADQSLIALGSSGKVIRVYSTRTGELEYEIPKKHTGWIYCVSFSPDGVLLATGDKNGGVFVWEAETGRQYLQLKAHSRTIRGLSWRSDSNILASCSADGSIRLWEMENGGQVKNWGAHSGGCLSVEFARDGRLLSCGRDKVTKLWDQNGKQLRAFEALPEIALQVTFCDETNRAIAGDWNGEIRVWDASDGKRLANLTSNPLRLSQRLEQSTKLLAELQGKHAPLAQAATASEAALQKVTADLASGQKLMADSKQGVETKTAQIAAYQKTMATLTTEYQAATKIVTALEPVVPLLNESLAKAQAAAAKATGDKELADLVAKLVTTSKARATSLEDNRKVAAAKNAELTKVKATMATAEKELATAQANLKKAQEAITKATAALKPARVKAAYDKSRAEQAAQAVTSTER
ncbi:MAG: c-type cytochrome domain-containing protein, partial [Pirellulaceae bacterium]